MVITTQTQLQELYAKLSTAAPVYIHIIGTSRTAHSCINTPSSIHFLFDDGVYMCYAQNHPDAPSFGELPIPMDTHFITADKKKLLHYLNIEAGMATDITVYANTSGNTVPAPETYFPSSVLATIRQFHNHKKVVSAVPLIKWMEFGQAYLTELKRIFSTFTLAPQGEWFVNDILIPTLADIERAGIFTTEGIVFSDYNIHTSTGRPSNAFGGINFAALNKHDGSRSRFVSRFGTDGTLVQFDYEAFHLRLAATLMNYTLPATSLHRYLAEQYYGTADITDEMYEESKARTFAIMYGQTDDTGGVAFFEKLKEYSSDLWEKYRQNGFVLSQTGRKVVVPDPNPSKVFNYLMQLMETEVSIGRISQVNQFLRQNRAKVVLYTYDAILLDVPNDELGNMPMVGLLLSDNGQYPLRQYRGDNYDTLLLHK
jgi:hypothetical protein